MKVLRVLVTFTIAGPLMAAEPNGEAKHPDPKQELNGPAVEWILCLQKTFKLKRISMVGRHAEPDTVYRIGGSRVDYWELAGPDKIKRFHNVRGDGPWVEDYGYELSVKSPNLLEGSLYISACPFLPWTRKTHTIGTVKIRRLADNTLTIVHEICDDALPETFADKSKAQARREVLYWCEKVERRWKSIGQKK